MAVYLSICLHKINMQRKKLAIKNCKSKKCNLYKKKKKNCTDLHFASCILRYWFCFRFCIFAVSPVGIEIETLSAIDRYFNFPINNN